MGVDSPSGAHATRGLRAELLAIYAEVDRMLSGFSCETSTECCRFAITGREPYPTAIELAEIARAVRAIGAPRPPRRLPLSADRACPLLSSEGRCTIYAARPFGCRTFFCERASGPGPLPRREIQRLSRAVAALSERFDPREPGPRPLTRALAGPSRR
jgi:Fe-S-cluster containining protein